MPDRDEQVERLHAALSDRYRVERVLGRGGMATVYLAEDLRHRRRVAIKVLKREVAATLGADRFLREIEIAAGLHHPHAVPVYDSGEAGGVLYFVMPYVEESLAARLQRSGPLPVRDAVRILIQVVDALSVAHERGIVHRDIKPHNILLSRDHAYLADFGVAKAVADARRGDGSDTTGGIALGTPAYMSPEQAAGEPDVDHRSDIYAVGVVAYEALAGRPPFDEGDAGALLTAHLTRRPTRVTRVRAEVPGALGDVVMRCLAKDRGLRWASAADLLEALRGVEVSQATTAARPARPLLGGRRIAWLAAPVVLALVLAGVVRVFRATGPARSADTAAVAAFPFRVAASDPELRYLREGIVDLLAASLNGEGGPRALVPQTVISAWRRAGGAADVDLPEDVNLRIARGLGAGQALLGSIVGSRDRLVVNASLFDADGGNVRARATVDGPLDSLPALVDRLAGQLLGSLAGVSLQRIEELTSTSLDALKAYLDGQAAYRDGRYPTAIEHFSHAIEIDSSFALAGLSYAITARWVTGRNPAVGSRIAWEHRHRLGGQDRVLLDAWLGPHGLGPVTEAELLAAREAAVQALSDQPQAWYLYADQLYHYGPVLGLEHSMERAMAAFQRALALDPSFGPAVDHVLERAVTAGDVGTVRALAPRYLGDGRAAGRDALRFWLVAAALQETPPLEDWRRSVDGFTMSELLQITGTAQQIYVDPDAALLASEAALRRATTQAERRSAMIVRMNLMHNLGRPWAAAALTDLAAEGEPLPGLHQWMHVTDWIFWTGDSAAAAAAAAAIRPFADRPAGEATGPRSWHGDNCAIGLFRARTEDVEGARRALRNLGTPTTAVPQPMEDRSNRICGTMLEVLLQVPGALERADSLALTGPAVSLPRLYQLNMVLAGAFERRGDLPRALAAIRRRAFGITTVYASAFLREEGRLAALTGDRDGAIRAYEQYLKLRSTAELSLEEEVARIRRELRRLVNEPEGVERARS